VSSRKFGHFGHTLVHSKKTKNFARCAREKGLFKPNANSVSFHIITTIPLNTYFGGSAKDFASFSTSENVPKISHWWEWVRRRTGDVHIINNTSDLSLPPLIDHKRHILHACSAGRVVMKGFAVWMWWTFVIWSRDIGGGECGVWSRPKKSAWSRDPIYGSLPILVNMP
jgi:hypothetical protein